MLKVALTNIDMDHSEEMEFIEMEKDKQRSLLWKKGVARGLIIQDLRTKYFLKLLN